MKRIYLAGSYSAPDVLSVYANMRRGISLAVACQNAGYAVYAPWFDVIGHLHPESNLSLEYCYNASMEWLRVSDAVLVVNEGWHTSRGTVAEVECAKQLGIPVFWDLSTLQRHFTTE